MQLRIYLVILLGSLYVTYTTQKGLVHMHNLETIRTILGVSREWLQNESGVSLTAIRAIESEKKVYRTNVTIADALAKALGVKVPEIFSEDELSIIGRTAHTGKPLGRHTAPKYKIHRTNTCNMETYTGSGTCTNCGQPLKSSTLAVV